MTWVAIAIAALEVSNIVAWPQPLNDEGMIADRQLVLYATA